MHLVQARLGQRATGLSRSRVRKARRVRGLPYRAECLMFLLSDSSVPTSRDSLHPENTEPTRIVNCKFNSSCSRIREAWADIRPAAVLRQMEHPSWATKVKHAGRAALRSFIPPGNHSARHSRGCRRRRYRLLFSPVLVVNCRQRLNTFQLSVTAQRQNVLDYSPYTVRDCLSSMAEMIPILR